MYEKFPEYGPSPDEIPEEKVLETINASSVTGNPFENAIQFTEVIERPDYSAMEEYSESIPLQICRYGHVVLDPDDRYTLERINDRHEEFEGIFGGSLINKIELIKYHDASTEAGKRTIDLLQRGVSREVSFLKKQLSQTLERRPETAETLENYPIPEKMRNIFLEKGDLTITEGLNHANDMEFTQFVLWNREYIVDKAEKFQPVLDEIKKEFEDVLLLAIDRDLPLDENIARKRLERIKLKAGDPLVLSQHDAGGLYDAESESAYIGMLDDQKTVQQIVYHELLHHLSGREAIRIDDLKYPDDAIISQNIVFRVGLNIGAPLLESKTVDYYRWLNEAVTEQLTQILLHSDTVTFNEKIDYQYFDRKFSEGVYRKERAAMHRLLTVSHLEFSMLLSAYFENLRPSDEEPSVFQAYVYNMLGEKIATEFRTLTPENYEKLNKNFLEEESTSRIIRAIFGID